MRKTVLLGLCGSAIACSSGPPGAGSPTALAPSRAPLASVASCAGTMLMPSVPQISLGTFVTVPTSGPIATGDFNADGHPDFATVSYDQGGTGTAWIALGRGDGTFSGPAGFATKGTYPSELRAGDVNGDGKLDIVALSTHGPAPVGVDVMLGDGAGGLRAPRSYSVANAQHMALKDLDGDGSLDIAVRTGATHLSTGTVEPLFNNGTGVFTGAAAFVVPKQGDFIESRDVDGDGRNDLILADSAAQAVDVLLNTGSGTFGALAGFPCGGVASSIAPGDFDKDGLLDLVVDEQINLETHLNLMRGVVGGGFGPPTLLTKLPGAVQIKAGDFNSDGHLDVAVLGGTALAPGPYAWPQMGQAFVLFGQGTGSFKASPRVPSYGVEIAAADFNGDGQLDLLGGQAGMVSVQLGKSASGFTAFAASYPTGAPVRQSVSGRNRMVAADFNSDGVLDVATSMSATTSQIAVMLGGAGGTFVPASSMPTAGRGAATMATGDVNGDGHADLAVANTGDGTVTLLLGHGDGTFAAGVNFSVGRESVVALADVDGNGTLDLVAASYTTSTVRVRLGHGDGTFRAPQSYASPTPIAMIVADFTGDGMPDITTSMAYSSSGMNVTTLVNDGAGHFSTSRVTPATSFWNGKAGDFDGDGKLDLAVDGSLGTTILPGNGDGTFAPSRQQLPSSGEGGEVHVADVDADGMLDVLLVSNTDNIYVQGFQFFHGNGDGTLARPVYYPGYGESAVVADLDGNGTLDVALAAQQPSTVTLNVALNKGCL